MDLQSVLDRFVGDNFILYGGDRDLIQQISQKVNVLAWFTTSADVQAIPPQLEYTRLYDTIYDAHYIVVGNGYVGRQKAEVSVTRILRAPFSNGNFNQRVIIFHGYPEFITVGIPVMKEVYNGGSIVALSDDKVTTLQDLSSTLDIDVQIPVPLRDVTTVPNVEEMIPYIHTYSRINEIKRDTGVPQIPFTSAMPIDIIDQEIQNPQMKMDYDPTRFTSAINWGQRKLLDSEIELLVEVIRKDIAQGGDGMGFLIVYVGAAPGSHIPHLLNLFARYRVTAHLWDRRERFDIPESSTISIIPQEFADPAMTGDTEGFFTDVVADNYVRRYGTNNRIIFVSDIRDTAEEEAVLADMELQRGWVERINPYASQLKFRLPFTGVDTYRYLDGNIYTQTWARNKSSESRLLSYRPYNTRLYNTTEYDRTFTYFNVITRVSSYDMGAVVRQTAMDYGYTGQVPEIGRYIPVPVDGLCTCHDCAREVQIIIKYLSLLKFPINLTTIAQIVKRNTEASRPYKEQQTNPRTLWTKVAVKVPPHDRKNLILFQEVPDNKEIYEQQLQQRWLDLLRERNIMGNEVNAIYVSSEPLTSIVPASHAKILMYADGLTQDEIIDALLRKPVNAPLLLSSGDTRSLFPRVLTGQRFPVVFNFHTDFATNPTSRQGIAKDLGTLGKTQFNRLLQNIAISSQTSTMTPLDLWGHVLLFVLQRMG